MVLLNCVWFYLVCKATRNSSQSIGAISYAYECTWKCWFGSSIWSVFAFFVCAVHSFCEQTKTCVLKIGFLCSLLAYAMRCDWRWCVRKIVRLNMVAYEISTDRLAHTHSRNVGALKVVDGWIGVVCDCVLFYKWNVVAW